jgi:hypothetical protein
MDHMGTTQSGAKNGPQNGSEVLLDQLNAQGVDGIFASPIAVMAPIWEALTRRAYDKPRYFRCRHELLAVSLASGYYKATGRGQIVFLPTSLGVQNGSMGPHTALQERTPMTVLSPDTLTYGEDPSADPDPEWPSLLVDLVGPVRNAEAVVKWSKRARTPPELVHELRRACFVAESVARGPTVLEIPFDLLVGAGRGEIPAWVTPAPVVAAPQQIDQSSIPNLTLCSVDSLGPEPRLVLRCCNGRTVACDRRRASTERPTPYRQPAAGCPAAHPARRTRGQAVDGVELHRAKDGSAVHTSGERPPHRQ